MCHNLAATRRLLRPGVGVVAVVKANAYGLGAVPVARAALSAGATALAVARVSEAVELREAGLRAPILNLAHTPPEEADLAVAYGVTPAVADPDAAESLALSAQRRGTQVPVHLKVDTGLSRFGAQPGEWPALLARVAALPELRVEGIASHFATADEPDLGFAREQLARFREALAQARVLGLRPSVAHIANSAGVLALPEAHLDLVRLGITLSGHYPSPYVPRGVDLLPAVALKARLARVFCLPAGASVGYGQTFVTMRPTVAGLVPAGYADGMPRALSGRGAALVRSQRAPLLGRVSMDQCVVDLTDLPPVSPGEEVVLFGRQGEAWLTLDEFAGWADTIVHEALCRVGPRVPRVYRDGEMERRRDSGRELVELRT